MTKETGELTRRDFLTRIGAVIAGGLILPPPDVLAKDPISSREHLTRTTEAAKTALKNQGEIEPRYEWKEVSLTVENNQFSENWDRETKEEIKTAAEEVFGILDKAYPGIKLFYDQVAIRPLTPAVIDYLQQNHADFLGDSDFSKMPFCVYPDTFKEGKGLLPGIYWLEAFSKDDEETKANRASLLAHEFFHYFYRLGNEAHNLERFSSFGASWMVEKYLTTGRIPGQDESPLDEINKHAKEAAENPCHCVVVKKGDTLWDLGQQYGVTVEEIMRMNRGHIENPDLIYPGQQLVIPAPGMKPNEFCGCIWSTAQ